MNAKDQNNKLRQDFSNMIKVQKIYFSAAVRFCFRNYVEKGVTETIHEI